MLKTHNRTITAKYSSPAVAAAAFIALLGFGTQAQAGHLGNGAQQRNQVGVNKCLAMGHYRMMKDQACKTMMAVHPELFPAGSTKPQNTPPH